jgi:hypothetical protein
MVFKDIKMRRQGAAGKTYYTTLIISRKLDTVRRLKSGESF